MGRELRRKEAKKNKINYKNYDNNPEMSGVETSSAVKITIIVVALLAILYLILAIFVTKELDLSTKKGEKTAEENNASSVSNAILASEVFNQSDETYYVLFYGFNNDDEKDISDTVTSKLTDYKVYKVDTESGFNKSYVSDTSNQNPTSIEDLKVKSPTLIQISADNVTKYVEGKENIEAYTAG